jgi:hypothetical protein
MGLIAALRRPLGLNVAKSGHVKKGSSSFLKKEPKNFRACAVAPNWPARSVRPTHEQKFFASFFQKRRPSFAFPHAPPDN